MFGYLIVHLMLCFLHDASRPQAFLEGDRSEIRMKNIQNVLQAETLADFYNAVLSQGLPGDYLWQAVVFRIFRRMINARLAVILVQILFCAISFLYLALIADFFIKNARIVIFATLFYAVLPHNFIFPHWLVSEAFFVPFGIIASYYSISYLFSIDPRLFSEVIIQNKKRK